MIPTLLTSSSRWTRLNTRKILEKHLARDKHRSLFCRAIVDAEKTFYNVDFSVVSSRPAVVVGEREKNVSTSFDKVQLQQHPLPAPRTDTDQRKIENHSFKLSEKKFEESRPAVADRTSERPSPPFVKTFERSPTPVVVSKTSEITTPFVKVLETAATPVVAKKMSERPIVVGKVSEKPVSKSESGPGDLKLKPVMSPTPGPNVIKLFTDVIYEYVMCPRQALPA